MGCVSGEWDDTEFNVVISKDYDYNIMMMSTVLGLTVTGGQKKEIRTVNGKVVKFKYHEVVVDH